MNKIEFKFKKFLSDAIVLAEISDEFSNKKLNLSQDDFENVDQYIKEWETLDTKENSFNHGAVLKLIACSMILKKHDCSDFFDYDESDSRNRVQDYVNYVINK